MEMKEGFPWQVRKDMNPPKFFYNFIGPDTDELDYVPAVPETELSLGLGIGGSDDHAAADAAGREGDLMEKVGHEQQAQAARRIALLRRDKQVARIGARGETDKRVGFGPLRIPFLGLKRQVDGVPIRILPASPTNPKGPENNPEVFRSGTSQPLAPRGKALSLGSGSSTEKSDVVADVEGSPWANSRAKKLKAAAVEDVETVIIPQPMPDSVSRGSGSGSGSGWGDVILKGYVAKSGADDDRIRIICVCHGHPLTPDEFLKHAAVAPGGGGFNEPTCYVTVSRDTSYRFQAHA